MDVSVFGLGYVGCVTAACLAKAGHQVIGVDINADKVSVGAGAGSPVVEPGLEELVGDMVRAGRLTAPQSAAEAGARSGLGPHSVCAPGPGARQPRPSGSDP